MYETYLATHSQANTCTQSIGQTRRCGGEVWANVKHLKLKICRNWKMAPWQGQPAIDWMDESTQF